MRTSVALLVLGCSTLASAQVWEKLVAPGLTYRMEYDSSLPRVLHALRWSSQSSVTRAEPAIAGGAVYSENLAQSRSTVSDMVEVSGAIAGINADFFPWTGDPLGLMVKERELVSRPFPNRSAVAWGPGNAAFGRAAFDAVARFDSRAIVIDGLNEECGDSMVCVNAPIAGYARSRNPGTAVVIQLESDILPTNGATSGVVTEVLPGFQARPVHSNEIVLVAGNGRHDLGGVHVGERVTITNSLSGFDWDRLEHCVAGGPMLVRNGKWANSWDNEGFKPDFALKRHPRTAVGRTSAGELWFVTIDGRQSTSIGATLEETAKALMRLGCVEAINLDGGGSTTLNVLGQTMNRPSDGNERPVANGVVFLGPRAPELGVKPTILGPAVVSIRQPRGYRMAMGPEFPISNSEILWSASGAAWVDQGGLLRPLRTGRALLRGTVYGRTVEREIEVIPGPDPELAKAARAAKARGKRTAGKKK